MAMMTMTKMMREIIMKQWRNNVDNDDYHEDDDDDNKCNMVTI